MLNTSTQVQLIQCQLKILETLILADGLVEHDANWLKNAGSVMRDASGRFARKAQSVKEDATALAVGSGEMLKISASEISAMVKDPAFRERAGLSSSMLIGQSIGNLVAKAKIFPGLSAEIDKMIAQQEKKLADIYGDDNTALAQAFRKSKLPQPPKDASMKEKMEFYVARYQAYDDVLKSPEFYQAPVIPEETTMDAVAKVAKASVPVAVGIGLTVAPEILIPLLIGAEVSIPALAATSLVSYGASEAASFGLGKVLDKTGLSQTQKTVADIAVRMIVALTTAQFMPVKSFTVEGRKYKTTGPKNDPVGRPAKLGEAGSYKIIESIDNVLKKANNALKEATKEMEKLEKLEKLDEESGKVTEKVVKIAEVAVGNKVVRLSWKKGPGKESH